VGGLVPARLFEAEDRGPLRIHAAKHVSYDTVLPGCIEGLKHDEKRLVPIRVEQVLKLVHPLDVLLHLRQRLVMGLY
jgi:hypothetical protein